MSACDDFIRRIVSRSGIVTSRARRDLERELHTHLEDAMEAARLQGCDAASVPRIVCDRFGDPDEIALQFAVAHQFERRAASIAHSLALMGIAVLMVAGLILALQLLVAICSGTPVSNAFPHLREESIGFASLALGYMGLYLEERLFKERRLIKALVLNSALFTLLFTLASLGLHLATLAPVLAFISGVAVRTLQQSVIRPVWFLGTAIPMAAAFLSTGPLTSASGRFPVWAMALVRCTGLTLACYALTLLARRHLAHARTSNHEQD